jgi:hypothetical protein
MTWWILGPSIWFVGFVLTAWILYFLENRREIEAIDVVFDFFFWPLAQLLFLWWILISVLKLIGSVICHMLPVHPRVHESLSHDHWKL